MIRPDFAKQLTVQTSWIVFTGPPSSGKTTTLKEFSKIGYNTISEVARDYIEEELKKGHKLHEIRENEADFQKAVLDGKIRLEDNLPLNETIVLDRGMQDSVTYFRLAGLDPYSCIPRNYRFKYKVVFLFEPLTFIQDEARVESKKEVDFITLWLERDYLEWGYNVVRVPVMPLSDRVEFIKGSLNIG